MGSEMKFKAQWEMGNEGIAFDSTWRNESKSSSRSEPSCKKHKLVSGLISLEKDDNINVIRPQNNGEIKHNKRTRKRNQTSSGEFDALDDFKQFVGSLLRDLEATSENLFAQMKVKLRNLVSDDTIAQFRGRESFEENNRAHCRESVKLNILVQNSNSSNESFEESGLENCFRTLEDLDHYAKADAKLVSTQKSRGEKLDFHVKLDNQSAIRNGFVEDKVRPIPNSNESFSYNTGRDREFLEPIEISGLDVESNVVSTPPFPEHRRPEISSRNYVQPRVLSNSLGMNFGVPIHGRFDTQSSENLVSLVPRNNPASRIGTVFSTTLHRGIESIDTDHGDQRNQVSFANQNPGRNFMSGLSMDGRAMMNFSGGRNHRLSSLLD